jgi:hypothetical protein
MVTVYQKHLQDAIERTKALGLAVEDFHIDKHAFPFVHPIVNEARIKQMNELLYERVYHLPIDEVAFHCSVHSIVLQKEIEKLLRTETLLTSGYFEFRGKTAFHHSIDQLNDWVKQKASFSKREIHVWLTLPSLEVIDITALASLLKVNDKILGVDLGHVNYQNCIIGRPDDLEGDHSIIHKPQFVGFDFLRAVGMATPVYTS